jgi:prepilin-type N-terminal cleavage/methylation domain-containing protein
MIKKTSQKGFTLIEMVVAIMIFVMVAMVALGALIKIVDANRKSISMKNSITNLNFALESMTRELRVGSDYNCYSFRATPLTLTTANGCPGGYTSTGLLLSIPQRPLRMAVERVDLFLCTILTAIVYSKGNRHNAEPSTIFIL